MNADFECSHGQDKPFNIRLHHKFDAEKETIERNIFVNANAGAFFLNTKNYVSSRKTHMLVQIKCEMEIQFHEIIISCLHAFYHANGKEKDLSEFISDCVLMRRTNNKILLS
jgi:hypothetical protein